MTQHYLFAYFMLVPLCLSEPRLAPLQFTTAEGEEMLRSLWVHAGQHSRMTGSGKDGLRDGAGLGVQSFGPVLIITLPPPAAPPEAHAIALAGGRVFALEMGEDFETGEMGTFLCEWTQQGHTNYGPRGRLTSEEFTAEVQKLLEPTG